MRAARFLAAVPLVLACAGRATGPTAPPAPDRSAPPHEIVEITSARLGETRRAFVYAPRGSGSDLPALYLLDGGIDEDFPHVADTIDSLVRSGAIEPIRIVGIENTQRRRDVTPHTEVATDREIAPSVGGAEAFRAFVREELIPEIERRYGTSSRRAILGESLAGLFVIDTLLSDPALFHDYVAISPSLWWNDREALRSLETRVRRFDGLPRRLYLTAANEEGIALEAAELAAKIEALAPPGLELRYVPRPDLEHSTIFRTTEADAYRALFAREPAPADAESRAAPF